MNIVLDTNILISALIKDGVTRDLIVNSQFNFLIPEVELIEIYKHKQLILDKAKIDEKEFKNLLDYLLNYVKIIKIEDSISYKKQSEEIMNHIDPDDVPFIAAALSCNASIWSDDFHFQKQNTIKIFTTKDMINLEK